MEMQSITGKFNDRLHGEEVYSDPQDQRLLPEHLLLVMRQKQIHFSFLKVTEETNKMVSIFESIYNDPQKGLEMHVVHLDPHSESHEEGNTSETESERCDVLLSHMARDAKVPLSLKFLCAKTVTQQPDFTDYITDLPEELQEYILDVEDYLL
eukprot:TRINITY_DN2244_c0_g1_i2.p2 TRINITY_DN2244_c0_g1~~TRINITY_DN2244_c0_g1_i2.p2  ORF type:complete len:153 (+),score=35.56 TRINITY_DN2244_c0_g1_i2:526-984(+)